MTSLVRTERNENIVTITLDRPEVRNALSLAALNELSEILNVCASDQNLRAVIITGAGDKAFSAGADLKERQTMTEKDTLTFVLKIQSTCQQVADLKMSTIAALNGDAFGGGLELALACDLRVLSASAHVGLVECSLGIIPGAGGTQRLPRVVGFSTALDLILGAKRLDAKEALSVGLVNYVAKNEECRAMAFDVAKRISANAPLAVRAAKEAILASLEKNFKDGLVAELACYQQILESQDRKEGLKAFMEKRAPHFVGK